MKSLLSYLDFPLEDGKPLSEINPGSDDIALTIKDVLHVLNILNKNQVAILGGEIFSEKENGKLVYAYQFWGDGQEFHCLDWYCDKTDYETQEDYVKRSYDIAKDSIKIANDVAKRLGKRCYVAIYIQIRTFLLARETIEKVVGNVFALGIGRIHEIK